MSSTGKVTAKPAADFVLPVAVFLRLTECQQCFCFVFDDDRRVSTNNDAALIHSRSLGELPNHIQAFPFDDLVATGFEFQHLNEAVKSRFVDVKWRQHDQPHGISD